MTLCPNDHSGIIFVSGNHFCWYVIIHFIFITFDNIWVFCFKSFPSKKHRNNLQIGVNFVSLALTQIIPWYKKFNGQSWSDFRNYFLTKYMSASILFLVSVIQWKFKILASSLQWCDFVNYMYNLPLFKVSNRPWESMHIILHYFIKLTVNSCFILIGFNWPLKIPGFQSLLECTKNTMTTPFLVDITYFRLYV